MSQDRSISAMVRVRNEEEFLEPALLSIVELVDELVVVDNASTDRTPQIVERLRRAWPDKLRSYDYPHVIGKVGQETWELTEREGDDSPRLSSTYYNFALERCARPFVLKWDGDMIALDRMPDELALWRESGTPVMVFQGVNVHPDRRHRMAARSSDREKLLSRLETPALPRWVTSLTYDFPEPRLFPRRTAFYESEMRWTQRLRMPDHDPARDGEHRVGADAPCFLHLKFCKRQPLSNYSADLAAVIESNIAVGAELAPEERAALERWNLT